MLATDYSMRLSDLLVPFMKLSNNMHAEALTKAMGAKRSGAPGTWSKGLAATRAYLISSKVPMSGVSLSDGSGLTRANTVTPRALGALLVKVQREPWFAAFKASLPVAGNSKRMVGGTLRHRMNGTRAANNAWAKTGTLTGVTALSGYVRGRDGHLYVFSMLSSYYRQHTAAGRGQAGGHPRGLAALARRRSADRGRRDGRQVDSASPVHVTR